jgi:UDP-N-acetylglucosamine 4,6-dehydratase
VNKMSEFFSGKKILVTGGTGSIGSCIVKELLKFNVNKVCVFSRDEIKQFMMRKIFDDKRLNFIVGDVREYESLERVFLTHNFDVVYHTAALKHVVICEENPLEAVKTNVIGTQNVVDLAKKYGVPKLINISTDKAVNPCNVMGATKLIGERIVLNANYTSVRFGNVAGTRGSVIPVLVEEIIRKRQISITNPKVSRFVMKVSDAVKLVLNVTRYAKGGEIFVLKMKGFKLSDLVDLLVNQVAPNFGIRSEEVKVNITGLLLGEKIHENIIDELEVPYLHDLGDFYVITPRTSAANIQRERLILSSNIAELISKDELMQIVNEYINTLPFLSLKQ